MAAKTEAEGLQALEYFYGDTHWARVHRASCSDTAREEKREGIGSGIIATTASSEREAIEEVAGDFIFANDHQAWTDYEGEVSFAPCVKGLPREAGV